MFKFFKKREIPTNVETLAQPIKPPAIALSREEQARLDAKYLVQTVSSQDPDLPRQETSKESIIDLNGMKTVINLSLFGNDELLRKCLLREEGAIAFEDLPETTALATDKMRVVLAEIQRLQSMSGPQVDASGAEIRKGRDFDKVQSLAALQKYISKIRERFGDDSLNRAQGKV